MAQMDEFDRIVDFSGQQLAPAIPEQIVKLPKFIPRSRLPSLALSLSLHDNN
jgi:hypothetical protein